MTLTELTDRVLLETDFHDYYDHWFSYRVKEASANDEAVPIIRRRADTNLDRIAAIRYMQELGLIVPAYALGRDGALDLLRDHGAIVVHDDLYAHQGRGKRLITRDDDQSIGDTQLAVRYVPPDKNGRARSFRLLGIGDMRFGLHYGSTDLWRSNCATILEEIEIRQFPYEILPEPARQDYAIFALDYVWCHDQNAFLAIDFNTAPQLSGTPVEREMVASQVAEALTTWAIAHHEEWSATLAGVE